MTDRKYRALGERIVVHYSEAEAESTTAGGILIPESERPKTSLVEGVVISKGEAVTSTLSIGDTVLFQKSNTVCVNPPEKTKYVLHVDQIVCKVVS